MSLFDYAYYDSAKVHKLLGEYLSGSRVEYDGKVISYWEMLARIDSILIGIKLPTKLDKVDRMFKRNYDSTEINCNRNFISDFTKNESSLGYSFEFTKREKLIFKKKVLSSIRYEMLHSSSEVELVSKPFNVNGEDMYRELSLQDMDCLIAAFESLKKYYEIFGMSHGGRTSMCISGTDIMVNSCFNSMMSRVKVSHNIPVSCNKTVGVRYGFFETENIHEKVYSPFYNFFNANMNFIFDRIPVEIDSLPEAYQRAIKFNNTKNDH